MIHAFDGVIISNCQLCVSARLLGGIANALGIHVFKKPQNGAN